MVAGRFYEDKSIEITSNNHKTFIEEDPGTPKVLLFLYKALSFNFQVSQYIFN